ncbi:MAG TPA: 4-hydroxy-3-methylbut-2-enyl diphosphate reductase, partial [Candidatus Angelobacter sp.]|nr:4-hydroxy-3-methylbut-2-enyl diphosphate reductase [Candidatus Angelobacter sp.]
MKIIRAGHLGMCFGVKDAIALATATARRGRLTILGDLVHNETVLADLRAAGIQFRDHPDRVNTPTAMITAHGASERALKEARSRGLNIVEATCPLVHFAHRNLQQLVAQGFHPVIIGRRDHVEVRGLTGDLDDFDVVLTSEDVVGLRPQPRFGVIAQTTQPIEKVGQLVEGMRELF